MFLWVALAVSASAAPLACESLDESTFIDLLLQGQSAVDRGDTETHRSRVAELQARLPCLTFAPRPRLLSEYYVLEALDEFAAGRDWVPALDAALFLRPGVDRGVGAAHPVARHPEPTPVDTRGLPVPLGQVVYVDGTRALELPADGGWHLVQITQGELWRSLRIDGAHPLPAGWFDEPFEVPRTWRWWGHAGVALGPGGAAQKREPAWAFEADAQPWAPDTRWATVWPALNARGAVAYGGVGVTAELQVAMVGFSRPVGDLAQVAVVAGNTVMVGAGVGVGGNSHVEGDPNTPAPAALRLTAGLPYGFGTVVTAVDRWDAGLSVGYGPSTTRASGYLGLGADARDGAPAARLGLSGAISQGRYSQSGDAGPTPGRTLDALTWRVGVEFGVQHRTSERLR